MPIWIVTWIYESLFLETRNPVHHAGLVHRTIGGCVFLEPCVASSEVGVVVGVMGHQPLHACDVACCGGAARAVGVGQSLA